MALSKLMTAVVDSIQARDAITAAARENSKSNSVEILKAPLILKATVPLGPSGVNLDFKS